MRYAYDYDVAVVGAGAAGLAAALAAARAGASVVVIDDGTVLGGALVLRPDVRAGRDLLGADAPGPDLVQRLAEQAVQGHVEMRLATTAWALFPGPVLHLSSPGGVGTEVRAIRIILATGATDAPLPFPGWTTPGVLTAHAARTLLHRYGVLPGRRALVVGSSSDAVALALALADASVEVVAVLEASAEPLAPAAALDRLQDRGISLRVATTIAHIDGSAGVQRVVLVPSVVSRAMASWGNASNGLAVSADLAVDVVVIAAGVVPEVTLPCLAGATLRYDAVVGALVVAHDETMRATGTALYVAGHVTGMPLVEGALAQGTLAGLCAAAEVRGRPLDPATVVRYQQAHDQARETAPSGQRGTAGHPLLRFLPERDGDEVIICRCEDVTLGEVRAAIAAGARSQDAIKRRTRAGMGLCQGRLCGSVINALIAQETTSDVAALAMMTARGPARPIPLSALTGPFASLDRPDGS